MNEPTASPLVQEVSKRSNLALYLCLAAFVICGAGAGMYIMQIQKTHEQIVQEKVTEITNTQTALAEASTKLTATEQTLVDTQVALAKERCQGVWKAGVGCVESQVEIMKPVSGEKWCIGSKKDIVWKAPEKWNAVTILLQDALTEGNYAVATVSAKNSSYTWSVGKTTTPSDKIVDVEPGNYRVVISETNGNYAETSKLSAEFEVAECG